METTQDLEIDKLLDFLNGEYGDDYKFTVDELKNYYRVSEEPVRGMGRGAYAFIAKMDNQTKGLGIVKRGDILKPASWTSPAKHARGNLLTIRGCELSEVFGKYGVVYLRGGL